jgi:hypothetical protein
MVGILPVKATEQERQRPATASSCEMTAATIAPTRPIDFAANVMPVIREAQQTRGSRRPVDLGRVVLARELGLMTAAECIRRHWQRQRHKLRCLLSRAGAWECPLAAQGRARVSSQDQRGSYK